MQYWNSSSDEEKETLYMPLGTLSDEDQEAVVTEMGMKPIAHFHWDTGMKWFQKLAEGSQIVEGLKFRGGVESEMVDGGK